MKSLFFVRYFVVVKVFEKFLFKLCFKCNKVELKTV